MAALADWESAAFVAVLFLGFVIVLVETRGMSPFADDWDFIVHRRGLSATTLLVPHNPHLSLFPILIYKVWLKVFGASTYLWFRILAGLDIVLLAGTLGWVSRRYWGPWWGLLPPILLVTMGPAGTSLLWSFQVGYSLAISAGLAAVVIVSRSRSPWLDALGCLLLLISLGSSSQGIGFTVGAALILALRRASVRRWWLIAIPVVLYGIWYVKYGRPASETELSLWPSALRYVFESVTATLPAFFGLSDASPGTLTSDFGAPLCLVAVGGWAVAMWRGWRPTPLAWGLVVSGVVLWVAAALSDYGTYSRPANDPRYLVTNAMILLAVAAVVVPRPRTPRRGAAGIAVLLLAVAVTNCNQYRLARGSMYATDIDSRAELGALQLLRGIAPAQFSPAFPGDPGLLLFVTEQTFTSANQAFGLEYDDVRQIRAAPQSARQLVDKDLALGGEVTLQQAGSTAGPFGTPPVILSGSRVVSEGCILEGDSASVLSLGPGRYELKSGPQYSISVTAGRFAPPSFLVGTVPASTSALLVVRGDSADGAPWKMAFTGTGGRICRLR